jgi:hypothetical protein
MEITLKLTVEEVNGILQTLGQLPTSSGAWPFSGQDQGAG